MDMSGISSLISAEQAVTTSEARALVLRVGQEMTATILQIVDNQALLDLGYGRQLAATLQTNQQLAAGQTVQLVAIDVRPEQVTLRLVAEDMLIGPPGQQALASVGLADDPANRAALAALVSEGLPVTADAIQALRQAATSLGATAPEDVRAVAWLVARDLPQTAAWLAIVREGRAAGQQLQPLEDDLRAAAVQLLQVVEAAPGELDQTAPELKPLLEQLAAAAPSGQEGSDASALQAMVQKLTLSLEATLAGILEAGAGDEIPSPPLGEASAEGALPSAPSQEPGAPPVGNTIPLGTPAPQTADPGQPAPASVPLPPPGEGLAEVALPAAAAPSEAAGPPAPQPTAPLSELPLEAAAAPNLSASQPAGSPQATDTQATPLGAQHPTPNTQHPAATAQTPAPPHEVARRLIPALERAMQSATAAPTLAATTELRHAAERLVQALQFQQLDALLQPTAAEPYIVFPLPIPTEHGEGDLSLYVRDENGSPKINPDDVRLVIDLHLTNLRRVSILVHVFHRQLTCEIETESFAAKRLLEGAAPELRDILRGLGYAVDPIRCSMAGFSRRGTVTEVVLPLSKLGRLNVTA